MPTPTEVSRGQSAILVLSSIQIFELQRCESKCAMPDSCVLACLRRRHFMVKKRGVTQPFRQPQSCTCTTAIGFTCPQGARHFGEWKYERATCWLATCRESFRELHRVSRLSPTPWNSRTRWNSNDPFTDRFRSEQSLRRSRLGYSSFHRR